MKKLLWVLLALIMTAASTASAADLLDWLQSGQQAGGAAKPADDARLLTLEPGQTEMHPKISPDGKSFLVTVGNHRRQVVARRLLENGDPLNDVTDDPLAFDSAAWHGANDVTFLSDRAGSLGLWQKPADGTGVLRRLNILHGSLAQPVALDDGSVIAVRLVRAGNSRPQAHHSSRFDDWSWSGMETQIVRIGADGSERLLSEGSNPVLSPDGRQIAFSMAAGRSRHLFLMRTDGSQLVQLTDERCIDVQPAWSPDGKWIAFASNRADTDMRHADKGNWDVWAITPAGHRLTRLTRDAARDGAPSIAPDGVVLFHSDRKVNSQARQAHQVKGGTAGFHIWSVRLPAE